METARLGATCAAGQPFVIDRFGQAACLRKKVCELPLACADGPPEIPPFPGTKRHPGTRA
jgi:hypothetical protein